MPREGFRIFRMIPLLAILIRSRESPILRRGDMFSKPVIRTFESKFLSIEQGLLEYGKIRVLANLFIPKDNVL